MSSETVDLESIIMTDVMNVEFEGWWLHWAAPSAEEWRSAAANAGRKRRRRTTPSSAASLTSSSVPEWAHFPGCQCGCWRSGAAELPISSDGATCSNRLRPLKWKRMPMRKLTARFTIWWRSSRNVTLASSSTEPSWPSSSWNASALAGFFHVSLSNASPDQSIHIVSSDSSSWRSFLL